MLRTIEKMFMLRITYGAITPSKGPEASFFLLVIMIALYLDTYSKGIGKPPLHDGLYILHA